jgi:acetolactate synthase-1/2/3 large subunit
MVRQWQDLFFENRYSGTDKSLHKKDFVKAAEADGFGFAARITRNEEVRPVLEKFLAYKGPALLEVMTDQGAHVYPMIGPGMGYKDMITGPYIKPRDGAARDDGEDPSDGGSMF